MPEENDISREAIDLIGCNPDDLGYVGMEVTLPGMYRNALEPEWAYHSPKYQYVKGYEGTPHVTLLYGLLFSAKEHQRLIDASLETWYKPIALVFDDSDAFHSEDDHALYSAIVLKPNDEPMGTSPGPLKEANDRLRRLPHVCPFPVYTPHVTVGYVRREFADQALGRIRDLGPLVARTLDLEYS